MSQKKAIAISGPSNSGKTTLILKLIEALKDRMKVAVIKHDPKDKAIFDIIGKDSQRFFESGANTLVVSPTRTTLFRHDAIEFDEMVSSLGDFDLLIVEGLKNWDLPRMSLFREKFDGDYLAVSNAVALSEKVKSEQPDIPSGMSVFDLDDVPAICEWILNYAKDIKWKRY